MRLYHFTSLLHLPRIIEAGYLKTVESNISLTVEHAGPDVVWLTEEATLVRGDHGLGNAWADKTHVRFTVEVPDAENWRDFAHRHNIERGWYRALDTTAGFTARYWFVVKRPIQAVEWTEIRDMATGQVLK